MPDVVLAGLDEPALVGEDHDLGAVAVHLVWMAVIAGFVLAEKIAPPVLRIRYASAVALVGWGALTLAAGG